MARVLLRRTLASDRIAFRRRFATLRTELSLSLYVFAMVLLAAFLHAAWNVLVKLNLDRFLMLFMLQTLMGFIGVAMLLFAGQPGAASLPYALASGVLHTGYNLFLARSYKTGDLSLVYPLARGGAPLLTLLGSLMLVNDKTTPLGISGILVLILGLLLISLSPGARHTTSRSTLFFAAGTAVFIAVYTVVDGMGARVSGNAIGYAGLVFVLDALFLFVTGIGLRGVQIVRQVLPHWKAGAVGAAASAIAYALVIWAMTQAPIAAVAALRETSILFVMFMSARYLKESLTLSRISGCLLIVAGAVLLRLS